MARIVSINVHPLAMTLQPLTDEDSKWTVGARKWWEKCKDISTCGKLWRLDKWVRASPDFMAGIFFKGVGLFQQDDASWHTSKLAQGWFKGHGKEFEVFAWPPNSPDKYYISDLLRPQLEPFRTWCQTPQRTFRALVGSMPWRGSASW